MTPRTLTWPAMLCSVGGVYGLWVMLADSTPPELTPLTIGLAWGVTVGMGLSYIRGNDGV
jgi:hypothetical protein